MPGDEIIYVGVTEPISDETGEADLHHAAADADIENLIASTPPGVPEHFLHVKIGAIMMITRNLSLGQGLCNGTRVQILPNENGTLSKETIRIRILLGRFAGCIHDLTRITFEFGGDSKAVHEGLIKAKRIQFPLRPGSVITFNRSQGTDFLIYFLELISILRTNTRMCRPSFGSIAMLFPWST